MFHPWRSGLATARRLAERLFPLLRKPRNSAELGANEARMWHHLGEFACGAPIPPLFRHPEAPIGGSSGTGDCPGKHPKLAVQGFRTMRKIALFAAASAVALTLAACSEATQDAAEATGDEMQLQTLKPTWKLLKRPPTKQWLTLLLKPTKLPLKSKLPSKAKPSKKLLPTNRARFANGLRSRKRKGRRHAAPPFFYAGRRKRLFAAIIRIGPVATVVSGRPKPE